MGVATILITIKDSDKTEMTGTRDTSVGPNGQALVTGWERRRKGRILTWAARRTEGKMGRGADAGLGQSSRCSPHPAPIFSRPRNALTEQN